MYESPIRLLVQQLETSIREQQEKQIFEAIQKCGIDVDREELIKALAYDRAQYAQGYSDGRADAHRWISVEERLPEKGVFVVVYYGHFIGNLMDVYMWDGECWRSSTGYLEDAENITHWMPLPKPPKEATP